MGVSPFKSEFIQLTSADVFLQKAGRETEEGGQEEGQTERERDREYIIICSRKTGLVGSYSA